MKVTNLLNRFGHAIYLVVFLALSATTVLAQNTSNWTNSSGGNFSDSGNWDNGVPSANNISTFSLPNTYTVNIDGTPQTTASLVLNTTSGASSNVTFNITGSGYFIPSAAYYDPSHPTLGFAVIGQSSGSHDNLAVQGNSFSPSYVQIARDPGSQGSLTVNGAMSAGTIVIGGMYYGAPGGQGTLTINSGANLNVGTLYADSFSGGAGSQIVFNGGTMTITGGATFDGDAVTLPQVGNGTDAAVLNIGTGAPVFAEYSFYPGSMHPEYGALNIANNATVNFNDPNFAAALYVSNIHRDTSGATPGAFNFVAGNLHIGYTDGPSLTFTANGQLGATLDLDGAKNISAPSIGTVVASDGTLRFSGGSLTTDTFINNGGNVVFTGGNLTVTNGDLEFGPHGINANGNGNPAIDLAANPSNNSITVSGATTVAAGYTLTIDGDLVDTGTFATSSGATATINFGSLIIRHGDLTIGPGGINGGTTSCGITTVALHNPNGSNTSISVSGTTTVASGYALTLVGGGYVGTGSLVTNSGGITTIDGGSVAAGYLTTDTGGTTTFTSGQLQITAGDLVVGDHGVNGNSTLTIGGGSSVYVASATTINPGYSFTLNGGTLNTGTFTNNGGEADFNGGTLTIRNGDLAVGAPGFNSAVTNINANGSITLSGGVTVVSGAFNINHGYLNTNTFVNTGGTSTFNGGSLNIYGGDLVVGDAGFNGNTFLIDSTSNVLIAAGTTQIDAGKILLLKGGALTTNAISRAPGATFSYQGGVLTVNAGDLDIGTGPHGIDNGGAPVTMSTYDRFYIYGNSTIDAGQNLQMGFNSSIYVAGDFTVCGSGSMNDPSASLIVNTFTTKPGGAFSYNGGGITIVQGGLNIGASGITDPTVAISDPNSLIQLPGALTIDSSHTLTLSAGTLSVGSIDMNGPNGYGKFGYSGGGLLIAGGSLTIGPTGQINNSPNITLTAVNLHGLGLSVPNGTITVQSGQALTVNGGGIITQSITNQGTFDYQHGTLHLTNSDLRIGGHGLIGHSLSLSNSDDLGISGTLTLDGASHTVLHIGNSNFPVYASSMNIEHGATLSTPAGEGDVGLFFGANSSGTLTNNGAVDMTAGNLGFFGSGGYVQGADGELDVSITAVPFAPFHTNTVLRLGGPASLAGTLQVSLMNGFKPMPGQSFEIIQGGLISGTLDALPSMNGRIAWNTSQLYITGALSVMNTFYAGDFNRDGHVDAADIALAIMALTDASDYRSAHGLTDPTLFGLVADVNGDGNFTNADLQYLLTTLKSGGGSSDSVPEPASCVLAFMALAMVSGTRFYLRCVR